MIIFALVNIHNDLGQIDNKNRFGDMKKASRSIIYKEKESIGFFLGEGDTLEREFLDKLRKRPFIQNLDDAIVQILRVFNNANYICTLIYEDDYPLLEVNEYEKIAIDNHDDSLWINNLFPATITLVILWLSSKESRIIFEKKGELKNIEELCKEFYVRIEKQCSCHAEGLEDYIALISQERHLPSGFINERCFQRRTFAEVIEDPSVKSSEVFDSFEYFASIAKNNLGELTSALDSDFIKKQLSNISFDESKFKSDLTEWVGKKMSDAKEEPTVIEQAFNAQTGLPCFTTRQIGILLTAVGRLTEKENQPGKTTLGKVVVKITGYKSKANSQKMKGTIPEADKIIVADALREQFPNLANEVMKVY